MVSPLALNPNMMSGMGAQGASPFAASPAAGGGGSIFDMLGGGSGAQGQNGGIPGLAQPAAAGGLTGSIGELAGMLSVMMGGIMMMLAQLFAGLADGSISGTAPAGSGAASGSGSPSMATSASTGGASAGGDGPTIGSGDVNTTDKMRKLAEAGKDAAMGMGGYNSQGLCATGVSRALSSALGLSVHGNGNQIDNNLPKDKFKQVDMSLEEALKTPGLILTWESTSTAAGSKYGHTAITLGDGHSSASDFIEKNTTNNGRTGLKIFMPV